jgi:hypothetical protein
LNRTVVSDAARWTSPPEDNSMQTSPTRVLLLALAHVSILGLVPTDSADFNRAEPTLALTHRSLPFTPDVLSRDLMAMTPAPPPEKNPRPSRWPYESEIAAAADRHGVDPLLLAAIVKAESGFDPDAVSARGAVGLMQILPSTANEEADRLLEPARNLDCGGAYLRSLLEAFGGDLKLALAAYNAGPTQVRRFGGIPPFAETEAFVDKVLATYVDLQAQI